MESRDILWGPRDPLKPSNNDHLHMSPKMTLRELVLRAKVIAEDGRTVPDDIFRLFQAVIAARKEVSAQFKALGAIDTTPAGKYPNGLDPHVCFINTLSEAFVLLGGEEWKKRAREENQKLVLARRASEEEDRANVDANIFENLTNEGQYESDGSSRPPSRPVSAKKLQKRFNSSPRKSKKKATTPKGKQFVVHSLDSYEIVDDTDGANMDYLLEARHVTLLMVNLRHHCESLWVSAYEGQAMGILASSACNMAVAMLKRESTSITINYQSRDSYDRILSSHLVHSGEVKNTYKGNSAPSLETMLPHLKTTTKEAYLVFAWEALCEFVTDFQASRSGCPTPSMKRDLDDFHICLDVPAAKMKDRLVWRRRYAINWLYDLVCVAQSRRPGFLDEEMIGPNLNYRMKLPLGFDTFAKQVAELAALPNGVDFRSRILPQHVLQMQLYLDAFTIRRGWTPGNPHRKIRIPYSSVCSALQLSRLTRNDDHRCDYDGMRALDGVSAVAVAINNSSVDIHCDRFAHYSSYCIAGLGNILMSFAGVSFLAGECIKAPKRSRFAAIDSNGLFHYSPYLSGAATVQMMNRIRLSALAVWDTASEPVYILHLYNKLRVRGLLPEMELWQTMLDAFRDNLFDGGTPPVEAFAESMAAVVTNLERKHKCFSSMRTPMSTALRQARFVEDTLQLKHNSNYIAAWVTQLCEEADWDVEKADHCQLPAGSVLAAVRSLKSDKLLCVETIAQLDEDTFLALHCKDDAGSATEGAYRKAYQLILKIRSKSLVCRDRCLQTPCKNQLQLLLLEAAQMDISEETNGRYPILSWNLFNIHMLMIDMISTIHDAITKIERGEDWPFGLPCARALIIGLLGSENEESLALVKDVFQRYDIGMSHFCYWEDRLRPTRETDMHRSRNNESGKIWEVEHLNITDETSWTILYDLHIVLEKIGPELKKNGLWSDISKC